MSHGLVIGKCLPYHAGHAHLIRSARASVFSSERYGEELGSRIGAQHTEIDLTRQAVPVSGTAIRRDPMNTWEFIPPAVRPYFVRRIAVLGAESTGKTSLAAALAARCRTEWVPEYDREFCANCDPLTLTECDFDAIGQGQLAPKRGRPRSPTGYSRAIQILRQPVPGAI